jgi:hypothetical protein
LGLDIPPDLERPFVIEELLEAQRERDDSEAGEERDGDLAGDADYPEPAPLPRRYNITYIKTLIRDPLWVFVFWEVKEQDKELYEKARDFEGYYLRASPAGMGGLVIRDPSFTVPVGPDDTAWYLAFPPEHREPGAVGGGWYQVELCVSGEARQTVLAVSRPFKLPALLPSADMAAARSPLAGLSAIDELPVIRSGDRLFRLPRGSR